MELDFDQLVYIDTLPLDMGSDESENYDLQDMSLEQLIFQIERIEE